MHLGAISTQSAEPGSREALRQPNPNPNPNPNPKPKPKLNPNPNPNPNPSQALRQLIATPDPFLALRARASWSELGLG